MSFLDLSSVGEVYLACGRTDMRKSIDGLAAIIEQQFRMDPFTRTLFLFCGRRAEGAPVGGRWLPAHLQAARERPLPVAARFFRSQAHHAAAAPLAHGRPLRRAEDCHPGNPSFLLLLKKFAGSLDFPAFFRPPWYAVHITEGRKTD